MEALSTLSVIPVRKEPNDRSEMVSQVLFGEQFIVEETQGTWSRITIALDGYSGWIDKKQVTELDPEEAQKLVTEPETVSLDLVQIAVSGKDFTPILLGSTLPFYYGKKFFIGQKEFIYDGQVKTLPREDASQVTENAFMFINAPYLWGGRSPFGVDCSGLTQMVFKLAGIKLKRDAWEQAEQGKKIDSLREAREGDLAFFKNDSGRISHVGIVLSGNRIIHASGKVRIDRLDEEGIFNGDLQKHTHPLARIRRMA